MLLHMLKLVPFGTQFDVDDNGKIFPMPIKDPKKVDELRLDIGLESLSERIEFMQERQDRIRKNRIKTKG
jgi:hypothetical protein